MYELVDTRTGDTVGTYKTRRRAQNAGDRKNFDYGSYRYAVRWLA
jgi:hypothetical protein